MPTLKINRAASGTLPDYHDRRALLRNSETRPHSNLSIDRNLLLFWNRGYDNISKSVIFNAASYFNGRWSEILVVDKSNPRCFAGWTQRTIILSKLYNHPLAHCFMISGQSRSCAFKFHYWWSIYTPIPGHPHPALLRSTLLSELRKRRISCRACNESWVHKVGGM